MFQEEVLHTMHQELVDNDIIVLLMELSDLSLKLHFPNEKLHQSH